MDANECIEAVSNSRSRVHDHRFSSVIQPSAEELAEELPAKIQILLMTPHQTSVLVDLTASCISNRFWNLNKLRTFDGQLLERGLFSVATKIIIIIYISLPKHKSHLWDQRSCVRTATNNQSAVIIFLASESCINIAYNKVLKIDKSLRRFPIYNFIKHSHNANIQRGMNFSLATLDRNGS